MQPAIKMALRIARQGADYLKAHFERQDANSKDRDTLNQQLNKVELSVQANFTEQLQKAYKDFYIAPLYDIDASGHENSWHIFPVLGREAFIRGLPEFALVLLQKRNNRAEHLVLINPVTGEEYSASRGHGAALNSRRVRCNEVRALSQVTLVTNALNQVKFGDSPLVWGELLVALGQETQQVRSTSCAALDIARVCAGLLDAAVIARPEPAELAIGLLLTNESGALSGDFAGNPSSQDARQLVVANPKLFKEVLKLLHPFRGRLPR